jgi:hypothetical protein
MKQYRFTSADFVPLGESGDDDAVMHPDDLAQIKKLAGMPTSLTEQDIGGAVGGNLNNVPNTTETGTVSPMGSSVNATMQYRKELISKYQAHPGSDLWMLISFEKPKGGKTLEQYIHSYLDRHPDQRPVDPDSIPRN